MDVLGGHHQDDGRRHFVVVATPKSVYSRAARLPWSKLIRVLPKNPDLDRRFAPALNNDASRPL